MKNKQRYYRLNRILEHDAEYNILLGERSNGKSYAVKERLLTKAFDNGNKFIYLRRWQLEVKPSSVEAYFSDMPIESITKGKSNTVVVNRGRIYLARFVDETNELKDKIHVGYVMYLSGETHFKSLAYPDVTDIVFEEFVTNDTYLNDECTKLMSLVSTVARRRKIKVWMIGNTISRLNPYFYEWDLRNVPQQEQGTIDLYRFHTDQIDDDGQNVVVLIAVEFCENSGKNSKMFFGKTSEMITNGVWESKEYPHLEHSRSEYEKLYAMAVSHMGLSVTVELLKHATDGYILHVHPKSKIDVKRQITTAFNTSPYYTPKLTPLTYGDELIIELYNRNKITFSDNLTGSDFEAIIKAKGGL